MESRTSNEVREGATEGSIPSTKPSGEPYTAHKFKYQSDKIQCMAIQETGNSPERFVILRIQISRNTLRQMQEIAQNEVYSVSDVCKHLFKFGILYERVSSSPTRTIALSPVVTEEVIKQFHIRDEDDELAVQWNVSILPALDHDFRQMAIKYGMTVQEVMQECIQMGLAAYKMTRHLGYKLLIQDENEITEIILF